MDKRDRAADKREQELKRASTRSKPYRKGSKGTERTRSQQKKSNASSDELADALAKEKREHEQTNEEFIIATRQLEDQKTTIANLNGEISALSRKYIGCQNCERLKTTFDEAMVRIQKKANEELAQAMVKHIGDLTRQLNKGPRNGAGAEQKASHKEDSLDFAPSDAPTATT